MGVIRFLVFALLISSFLCTIGAFSEGYAYSSILGNSSANNPISNNPNSNTPDADNPGANDPLSKDPSLYNPFNTPHEDNAAGNNFFVKSELAEEVFLNLSYEKLFVYPLSAVLSEDKIYLPVIEFLKGLKINYEVKNSKKLIEGLFISNNLNYSINFELKTIKIGEKYIEFTENDFVLINDVYYIHPVIFENLFNAKIEVNFNKLVVEVKSPDKLPAMIYHERDAERTDLKKNEVEVSAPLIYKKDRTYLNAGFLDYSLSSNFMRNSDPGYNYNFDLGTEFLGGDLKTSIGGSIDEGKFNHANGNFLWKYALDKNSFLNQVYVGQLNYTGQYNGLINGIQITNTPVEQRVTFDRYTITETTVPNSDVELYINNQLYDYKKADALGNVFFDIPLNFGSNYIYLKIFSPTGEVLENAKKIQVPTGFLPKGSVDYNVSFGELGTSKEKLLAGDVSVGVTNWLTNTAGFEKITSMDQNATFYNSVSARLFSQYIMNVTIAPKIYNRATLNASFVSNLYFEVGHTQFEDNKLYNIASISGESYVKGVIPFEFADNNFVTQVQVKNTNFYSTHDVIKADIEQSLNFSNFRTSLRFSHIRNTIPTIMETLEQGRISSISNKIFLGTDYMLPDFGFLERNMVNTNIHYNISDKRFESLQTIFTTNITKNFKVQLKYQTNFTPGSNDISAQFVFELPFTRNFVTVGQNSVSTSLQGSVGVDLNYRKFLLYNKPQVGSSAVSFRMFYDVNNNGLFDSDEEVLKNGKLNFRESATLDNSDENVLRVTELVPNQEYIVEINESFLKDPLLIPKYKRFSFVATANRFKHIDIPFNMSQEIYGSVTVKSGEQELKLGGIDVVIKNLETDETTILSSYYDGGIYALQFVPGDYVAYVKPQLLKNLNAVSYPEKINFTISNNREESNNELNFMLEIQK